ncbi:MAG: DUF4249 domain-containing protein [Fulvivirga sp.]|nr:DUF4249 domain-containing protein [Fulvivirga sp.]
MKNTVILLIITLVLATCIEPAGIEPAEFNDFLVVEGFITDQPGPHKIKITRMAKFSGIREQGEISIEKNVIVNIIDEDGQVTRLQEDFDELKEVYCSFGRVISNFVSLQQGYQTPSDFQGEIGKSYTLEVITKAGKVYHSTPQTIRETPPIQSIGLSFKEIPTENALTPQSGVEIFSTWLDPAGEENFYYWRMNGIYQLNTPTKPESGGRICPNCLYDPDDGGAESCFIIEENVPGNLLGFADTRVDGQLVTKAVGFIEDDTKRFSSDGVPGQKQYYVELEQYAISKENYEFNNAIMTLENINGEIFDPPPLSVRGNMFNVEDPDDIIVGYFGAYQVQKKSLFIPRSILEFRQPSREPCGDCRVYKGAQTEVPEPYQ